MKKLSLGTIGSLMRSDIGDRKETHTTTNQSFERKRGKAVVTVVYMYDLCCVCCVYAQTNFGLSSEANVEAGKKCVCMYVYAKI
jgi:hypothetical protein